ncbi:hypothetical protein Ahy_B08g094456 [Arachis hypogaea]|uniref:Uncharacterized protein n=1 Tax=Arachis hypogaea TaxID=3818 RepID=A0A444Y939_ARAHY|nr:hypothetical protein Ahy_B08g094456 [Arachis hypogaea]
MMEPHSAPTPKKYSKKPKYSKFSQQELPAWKPILTPGWVGHFHIHCRRNRFHPRRSCFIVFIRKRNIYISLSLSL